MSSSEFSPSDLSDGEKQKPDAPSVEVRASGVDTVSFAWTDVDAATRIANDHIGERIKDVAFLNGLHLGVGVYRVGKMTMVKPVVGRGRVGAMPDTGMVFIEGRAGEILGAEGLVSLRRLPQVAARAANAIEAELDLRLDPSAATLRRVDLAVDLAVSDGGLGQSLLRAFGAVVPHGKVTDVWRDAVATRCVYLRSAKGRDVEARVYDKGHQTNDERPGEWLRAEWQFRRSGRDRPTIEQFVDRAAGLTPFGTWFGGASRIVFGGVSPSLRAVIAELDAGLLTAREAERLLGSAAILAARPDAYAKSTATLRRRALHRHGVGVSCSIRDDEAVEVDEVATMIVRASCGR